MRVEKSQVIGGVPAEVARTVVRHFYRPMVVEDVETLLGSKRSAELTLIALQGEGYLSQDHIDEDGDIWWKTTIQGNALAMASFGRPISRRTADRLAAELVERAKTFNADESKLVFVDRLRVFGSYLRPEVDPLGDLDIELVVGRRNTSPQAAIKYARASGRTFNTHLDELSWPTRELILTLKNRSAAINITQEDVSKLTLTVETLFAIRAKDE